jgi:Xaa-Pro aminopeptidase
MEVFRVPADEIKARIGRLQQLMERHAMEAVFIAQRMDLFYFSGTCQNGFLVVPRQGRPLLFIRRYLPRAVDESALEDIFRIGSVKEIPDLIGKSWGRLPSCVGFELDVLPAREFEFYRRLLGVAEAPDASDLIFEVRRRKSAWEVAQLEKTAEVSRQVFDYIRRVLAPGLMEMELAGMYETFARRLGHAAGLRIRDYRTEGYNWHILSGAEGAVVGLLDSPASGTGTSAAFPSGAGRKKLAPGESILIDMATVVNGYHMDETRMFALGGMPAQALAASRACNRIHDAIIAAARPGVECRELFEIGWLTAERAGFEEIYLGPPDYKVSFVGHGVGLELIEPPFIARGRADRLEAGMVFALEPKMLLPGEFAVGIESVFTVTAAGARLLSKVPVDIFIC